MLCDGSFLAVPDEIVSLAAEGRMMWNFDVKNCPRVLPPELSGELRNCQAGNLA